MNWTDFAVIAVIFIFTFICFRKGFILSLLDLGSLVITFIVTIKFYPIVSNLLIKTKLYDSITSSIGKNLSANPLLSGAVSSPAQISIGEVIKNLPQFVKDLIAKMIPNLNDIMPMNSIVNTVAPLVAKLIIGGISILLLFIAVRLLLKLVSMVIKRIKKPPVIKRIDKLLGIVVGVAEGLLIVYIAMAVIILLGALPVFKPVLDALDKSLFAYLFYKNNMILIAFNAFF